MLALLLLTAALGGGAFLFADRELGSRPSPAAAAPKLPPKTARIARTVPLLTAPHSRLHGAPSVSARSAILVDAQTGAVLWEKRAHSRRPVASTTKIMTATLALERLSPNTRVEVPGGSRAQTEGAFHRTETDDGKGRHDREVGVRREESTDLRRDVDIAE